MRVPFSSFSAGTSEYTGRCGSPRTRLPEITRDQPREHRPVSGAIEARNACLCVPTASTREGTSSAVFVVAAALPFTGSEDTLVYSHCRCDTKDPTGLQHHCCGTAHPELCPTAAHLSAITGLALWAEGVEGDFSLEVCAIAAGLERARGRGYARYCRRAVVGTRGAGRVLSSMPSMPVWWRHCTYGSACVVVAQAPGRGAGGAPERAGSHKSHTSLLFQKPYQSNASVCQ